MYALQSELAEREAELGNLTVTEVKAKDIELAQQASILLEKDGELETLLNTMEELKEELAQATQNLKDEQESHHSTRMQAAAAELATKGEQRTQVTELQAVLEALSGENRTLMSKVAATEAGHTQEVESHFE